MDRKDLKIEALRQRVASLTAQYEDQVADLRVDLTLLSEENENLNKRIQELEAPDATYPEEGPSDDAN
jgi:uncharacterized protein YeeX (DUF496 family)